jgi:hypothetical protein
MAFSSSGHEESSQEEEVFAMKKIPRCRVFDPQSCPIPPEQQVYTNNDPCPNRCYAVNQCLSGAGPKSVQINPDKSLP